MSPFASRFGRAASIALLTGSALVIGDAQAQPKPPSDEARALAREAWKALDAQNYKEALEKITQAETLYHAPTHMLVMGNAQVALGRLADALATFESLAAEPLPAAGPTAFKEAQDTGRQKMKELLARVPSLLVVVEGAGGAASVVTVDGKPIDVASGLAVRLDPGAHAIVVTAAGFESAKKSVTLPEKGGVVRVPIVLEKLGAAAASGSASAAPSATTSASAAPSASASASATSDGVSSQAPAYVVFVVGGISLVVGAVTGSLSLGIAGDLKSRCPENLCSPDDRALLDKGNLLAHTSTAAFVLAGVAGATGALLFTISGGGAAPKSGARNGVHIQPWVSLGGAGVQGRF